MQDTLFSCWSERPPAAAFLGCICRACSSPRLADRSVANLERLEKVLQVHYAFKSTLDFAYMVDVLRPWRHGLVHTSPFDLAFNAS